MELPSNFSEQIAFNTRSRIEEHILVVMNESTHEEHLFQPLQTTTKQFKIAVTFLSGYIGIFNVTNSKNEFYFKKSITDEEFIQIRIPKAAYEIEALNNEIKRIMIDQEYYQEGDYPFKIQPNFSTVGSIVEISPQGWIIGFVFDDSFGNLLGFDETTLWQEYKLSPNPVDILSLDNIFLECDIAQGMIFRFLEELSGIIHNFTMDLDLGYKYMEKFRGGVQWYIANTKNFITSINFKLKMKTMN